MTRRISGQNFDIELMNTMVHVEGQPDHHRQQRRGANQGIPDGYVDGDVSAECEFELDARTSSCSATRPNVPGAGAG